MVIAAEKVVSKILIVICSFWTYKTFRRLRRKKASSYWDLFVRFHV